MDSPDQVRAMSEVTSLINAPRLFVMLRLAELASQQGRHCRLLDLGCGTGEILFFLADTFKSYEVTGVDLSSSMLDFCRESAKELKLENVRFIEDDISSLNAVDDESIDLIFSSFSLHHFRTEDQLGIFFKVALKKLTKNGVFYAFDFHRLKSKLSQLLVVAESKKHDSNLMTRELQNSMAAAFSREEVVRVFDRVGVSDVLCIRTGRLPLYLEITNRKLVEGVAGGLSKSAKLELNRRLQRFPKAVRDTFLLICYCFSVGSISRD